MNERAQYFLSLVEEALYRIGITPAQARAEQPGQWQLKRGSAEVVLAVRPGADTKGIYLTMVSAVMEAPEPTPELMADLLRLNQQMVGAAFAISEGTVVLTATLDLVAKSPDGLAKQIDLVTYYADTLDDELKSRYAIQERPPFGFARIYAGGSPKTAPVPSPAMGE